MKLLFLSEVPVALYPRGSITDDVSSIPPQMAGPHTSCQICIRFYDMTHLTSGNCPCRCGTCWVQFKRFFKNSKLFFVFIWHRAYWKLRAMTKGEKQRAKDKDRAMRVDREIDKVSKWVGDKERER